MVHGVDRALARLTLGLGLEQSALLGFMFHGLFESREEAESGQVDAFQKVTVEDFRAFVAYFLERGYRFVGPEALLGDLEPGQRYAIITFDDGYANNLRAVPVLREFEVPAVFFISANHVREGRAFWWDALYRLLRRRGLRPDDVEQQIQAMKVLPYHEIESRIRRDFGPRALLPLGEADRPMTEAELKRFAAEPGVVLGNHTADHAILTLLEDEEIARQIRECQAYLETVTGKPPTAIAYPNGNHDDRVVAVAEREGLKVGFIADAGKAALPLAPESMMRLPRFSLDGGPGIVGECLRCRSDLGLTAAARRLRPAA